MKYFALCNTFIKQYALTWDQIVDKGFNITECSICFSTEFPPVILACKHMICSNCFDKSCIKNQTQYSKYYSLSCPYCRNEVSFPKKWVYFLQHVCFESVLDTGSSNQLHYYDMIYNGTEKNKKPHGYGELIKENQIIYQGHFHQGKKHGIGISYSCTGQPAFFGYFENDEPCNGFWFDTRERKLSFDKTLFTHCSTCLMIK